MAFLKYAEKSIFLISRRRTNLLCLSLVSKGARSENYTFRSYTSVSSVYKRTCSATGTQHFREFLNRRAYQTMSEKLEEKPEQSSQRDKLFSYKDDTDSNVGDTFNKCEQHLKDDFATEEKIQVPDDLTEADFIEICTDRRRDEYAKVRLKNLSRREKEKLRHVRYLYDNKSCQPKMTDGRWLFLVVCRSSKRDIRSQLHYWYDLDRRINCGILAKEERAELRSKEIEPGKQTFSRILRRIERPVMNVHYFNNLAFSMQFGQPLILDFSFAEHMSVRELHKAVEDVLKVHRFNKIQQDPFHLHVCGFPTEGKFRHILEKSCDINRPDIPVTFTQKDISELDHIPRERLVYLSPNSPNELEEFDHNDVYVIGTIVDFREQSGLTVTKAETLKIRSAKFPLGRYMVMNGRECLKIKEVMLILRALKKGVPMGEALAKSISRHVVKMYL